MAGKKTVPMAVAITAVMLSASIVVAILVFGPKTVGPVLEQEKPRIEAWLAWSGLDRFGSKKGTPYPEGLPEDRYDYIRSNHRQRPWNSIDPLWIETFAPGEKEAFEAWTRINNLNKYGDRVETMYTGGTPLFNEMTGKVIPLEAYALKNHPGRPWNHMEAK